MEQPRKKAQPLSATKETKSVEQKRKVPTAQELITHYERQGLETKEASVKVIEDLQKALFRVVTSSSSSRGNGKGENLTAETRRKLDVINTRLVSLDMKVDSKPGYGETLAIGVASGAALRGIDTIFPHLVRAFGNIWNAVRSATSRSNP